ncbi:MAG: leucyl aminopeptidase [Pseudohongiellaceae bacterium]
MRYSLKTGDISKLSVDCLAVMVFSRGTLSEEAGALDTATGKALSGLINSGDFSGKLCETQFLYGPAGVAAKRILLVGGGQRSKFNADNSIKALNAALKAITSSKTGSAHFGFSDIEVSDRDANWLAARLAQQAEDVSYRYDETKSKKSPAVALKTVSMSPPSGAMRKSLDEALKAGAAVGRGMNKAKYLGDLPGNVCTPTFLAKQGNELAAKNASVTTKVLTEKQMERLGMGSLLSVAAGSDEEAKLIIMEYKGAAASSRPYCLVGKGITFDTGGISLKPGLQMDEMKYDMCGAASVFGVMQAVAELKLPINVVAVVAAAENMPSSGATKPGDIVTSMSGKTIEILNTDAEGRLVLCDALTYAERFKPRSTIDIATLTGAAVATFGTVVSALLGNNERLAKTLLECGEHSCDPAWQLPLREEYQKQIDSNFADMANIGGPRAGAITAACFLSRFAEKQKWAHLDIAGSAWNQGPNKGATGRPVALLVEYLSRQKA